MNPCGYPEINDDWFNPNKDLGIWNGDDLLPGSSVTVGGVLSPPPGVFPWAWRFWKPAFDAYPERPLDYLLEEVNA